MTLFDQFLPETVKKPAELTGVSRGIRPPARDLRIPSEFSVTTCFIVVLKKWSKLLESVKTGSGRPARTSVPSCLLLLWPATARRPPAPLA